MASKSSDRLPDSRSEKPDIKYILYVTFVLLCLISTALWIGYTIINSTPEDFRVFYESAQQALSGKSMYRTYGPIELPYWYLPWLAWFYIPLAFFPPDVAYAIFIIASLLFGFLTVAFLLKRYVPGANALEISFVFSMVLLVCWLLFRVGQMDFLLLAAAVWMMHLIANHKVHIAAWMVPVLLFKPHLFVLFFPAALFKGKRTFLISATVVCLLLLILSFLIIADWPQQMFRMLGESGKRTDNNWGFITLPNMLGLQENWSGTANWQFTGILILAGALALWKIRELNTFTFLSISLAGSLFCAPRAYAYNLPLLVPAMIWLSADLAKPYRLFFWLAASLFLFLFRFSSETYLLVLVVFVASLLKVHRLTHQKAPDS
jgi:hypothetical protein